MKMLPHRHAACVLLAFTIATLHCTSVARAEDTVEAPSEAPRWTLTTKGGVSLFTTSTSPVLEHLLKPAVRLEASYRVSPRLEMGAEIGALITGDADYAFESASLVFRSPLYDGDVFLLRIGWGFGLGTGPPILSADLTTKAVIVPTMQASLSVGWKVLRDRLVIGLEIIDEQLTVVTAALTVGVLL